MSPFLSFSLLFLASSCLAQQGNFLPARPPSVTLEGASVGACPSSEVTAAARNSQREEIQSILRDTVTPALDIQQQCPCSGPENRRRIAHLDMNDPEQQCPPNWRLITTPERECGRSTSTCDSAIFPSGGESYSRVCGRVNAIQRGTPDAFRQSIGDFVLTLEDAYIDGVSITHGAEGSRQHIWSFVGGLFESGPTHNLESQCPCSNTNAIWPFQVPSYVGNDYFCDSGNPGPGFSFAEVYSDDPLWDGEGCGPYSTCCENNTSPWFCTTLPQPTTDDLELRLCGDQDLSNEDIEVTLVEIYIT